MSEQNIDAIKEKVQEAGHLFRLLRNEIHKVIIGQDHLVSSLIIALLADGHILLEGVPGLAKTLSISTLSKAIRVNFNRIQFTPDLLPADLIGTRIYNPQNNEFHVKKGPIFTNLLLADEINRAPAKVQSALLQAMQERQVTISHETFSLQQPFLVMATQNPLEHEGTYQLPEAQLDRFMFKVNVDYPTLEEEILIIEQQTSVAEKELNPILQPEDIVSARQLISQIYLDDNLKRYIVELVFATRTPEKYQLDLKHLIQCGASPRASIFLALCAKVNAFINERAFVIPEDIKAVGMDVLRHRVAVTYEAEAEEVSSESIIQQIFDKVKVP